MSLWERWIVVGVLLGLAWWGLTWFLTYWAEREAQRPHAPGLRSDHRRIS